MSNLNRFLNKGGKKKEEVARPKPAAAPLVEAGKTRPVDMSDIASAEAAIAAGEARVVEVPPSSAPKGSAAAELADDEQVTAEVDVRAPKAPPYPVAVPLPAATPRVVAPPPARRAPVAAVPSAPVEEAPSEASALEAEPAPSEKPKTDMSKLLESIKATVKGLLAPIEKQIAEFGAQVEELGRQVAGMQETVTSNDETITQFGTGLDELGETIGTLKNDLDTLKGAVGENDNTVTALAEGLDELSGQLLGDKPDEALAPFRGRPVVSILLGQLSETALHVDSIVGNDGERIPSIVNDNTRLTAKTFAIELLKKTIDEAKLHQAAVERGYDTSKDVLNALANNEEYAIEIVGALYLAPAESLDDADKAQLKSAVVSNAKVVSQRANYYLQRLDWSTIEKEGKAMLSGGDE